jgi:hypothetical protein
VALGLQAFERWLTQNGMGTDDKFAIGNAATNFAGSFDGFKESGRKRALVFDQTKTTD